MTSTRDTGNDRAPTTRDRVLTYAGLWIPMTFLWVGLWGDLSSGTVVAGGTVNALLLLALRPKALVHTGRFRLVPGMRLVVWASWSLVMSSAIVAWEVLTPRVRIQEGIVAVPLAHNTPVLLVVVVNLVNQIPGTIVVDVDDDADPAILYVHALHMHDPEEVRHEIFRLEKYVVAAIGPPDGVEDVERLEAES